MQLWIQRIIILPFVALFSALFVAIIARVLLPSLGFATDKFDPYARILAVVAMVVAVWLYVRSWKKGDLQAEKAPPRKPAVPLMTVLIWVLIIVVGGPLGYVSIQSSFKEGARKQQPGYKAFQVADDLLMGRSQGATHGNTPAAEALAREFSVRLKQARKLGIEARKSSSIVSLTGGEFLTYCLLTHDSCVFMVHVPDLRNFAPDAKDYIAEAAWITALAITEPSQANLRNVTVGLRGALLYDRVIAGRAGSPTNSASLQYADIDDNVECRSFLQGYFAMPPPVSSAASPASNLQPSSK